MLIKIEEEAPVPAHPRIIPLDPKSQRKAEDAAKSVKYCGNPRCSTSTGICGGTTHGFGELDANGYWSFPCFVCARHYERATGISQWPYKKLPPASPPADEISDAVVADKIIDLLAERGPMEHYELETELGVPSIVFKKGMKILVHAGKLHIWQPLLAEGLRGKTRYSLAIRYHHQPMKGVQS